MKILGSASKIVFIAMAIASIALALLKIMDVKDFVGLVMIAFTYYFTKPVTPVV